MDADSAKSDPEQSPEHRSEQVTERGRGRTALSDAEHHADELAVDADFWQVLGNVRTAGQLQADEALGMTTAEVRAHTADVRDVIIKGRSLSQLSDDERRSQLKRMLVATHARYERATRHRRPALAPGVNVQVVSGPFVGESGQVSDADYINSRVLLEMPGHHTREWVRFDQVVARALPDKDSCQP